MPTKTSTPTRIVIDVETGTETQVPLTAEEIADRAALAAAAQAEEEAAAAKAAQRAAILNRLGLTEDELRVLL